MSKNERWFVFDRVAGAGNPWSVYKHSAPSRNELNGVLRYMKR